ncbi:fimbrillin family protein [Parabacteroides sp. APC149_11_2_Y6]
MKKTLLVSLSATLLLAGCQKDDIQNKRQDGEKVHVMANLSQGTLTKVDVEPSDKGADVYWINGDQVSVFGNTTYAGSLSAKLGERAKKASFIGDITENTANNYFVVYPWNGNHESAQETAVPLPSLMEQTATAGNQKHLSEYTCMVSKEAGHLNANNEMEFIMEHLCSLLQFELTLTDAADNILLESIEVYGASLVNKMDLNVTSKKLTAASDASNKLNLKYPDDQPVLSNSATVTACMAAFPVSDDLRVRVFVNDNGAEKYLTFNASSVTFESGKRYTKTLALDMSQAKDASIMEPENIDRTAKTAIINTRAELAWVAAVTNVGNVEYDGYKYYSFSGWTLTQGKDIDLEGSETKQWVPIGLTYSSSFKGTYDGSLYEIENIYIDSDSEYQGLFGYVASQNTIIKNVILVSGTISGTRGLGLIGRADYCTIIACKNGANIIGKTSGYCGGIVGSSQLIKFIACENTGEISGAGEQLGGIAGTSSSGTFIACVNHGNVNTSSFYNGGICGYWTNGYSFSCINEGTVVVKSSCGGVFGYMNSYQEAKELYFINNPTLKVTSSDGRGNGWNQIGPTTIPELNSEATINSLNAAIAEWNTNNPDYASPYHYAAGGDDNTIPKLVPIE